MNGRRTNRVPEIRDKIRASILSGELAPDTPLSSVKFAERFQVSRTPLREAFRLLQEEGLVTMTDNHRPRVALTSPGDMDAVYSQRILISALCTSLSVPNLGPEEVATMESALDKMVAAHKSDDDRSWVEGNATFHRTHMISAPTPIWEELTRLRQRCSYFFTVWAAHRPGDRQDTIDEHQVILDACHRECGHSAAAGIATHLHRVGSALYRSVTPDSTPVAMDAALAQVTHAATP